MASDLETVLDDLRDEGSELESLVSGLSEAEWARQTPAPGWTVAHQIGHLAWTDDNAVRSATDQDGFADELHRALADPPGYLDEGAREGAETTPAALLARWSNGREAVRKVLRQVPPKTKLPWYGPPMSPASMATARLMETWAHGLDIADTLGVRREATTRLWHVARIGIRARDYAFTVNNLPPPAEPFRVELTGPCGALWTWGPEDAAGRVTGSALDFCLVAAQRRHRDDTGLVAVGADANQWLGIAQAFAGPPGAGREPGQFS